MIVINDDDDNMAFNVVANSSTYYLNTIANSQEFSLFKIVFQ